jgi:hypothetical protein
MFVDELIRDYKHAYTTIRKVAVLSIAEKELKPLELDKFRQAVQPVKKTVFLNVTPVC